MEFKDLGLLVPEVLLPKKGIDMEKWAVVACDQYTSQEDYWQEVKDKTGDDPSTLKVIFPEVYLEKGDEKEYIENINKTMEQYRNDGTLENHGACFIAVDRKTSHVPSRKGLIVALDLEHYDYREGSKTLIRASEGTIVSRLKPRIEVRKHASLELPHIMVLIDDPDKKVIEPLFDKENEVVYDTDLMMDGGHIRGYKISDSETINAIADGLRELAQPETFKSKYAIDDNDVLLYAMGDGNHSFATAKSIWETLKEEADDKEAIMNHPARYALVELVNLHDDGMVFEPIHRVMFNSNPEEFLAGFKEQYEKQGATVTIEYTASEANGEGAIPFFYGDKEGTLTIKNGPALEVEALQNYINDYMEKVAGSDVDYIHGSDVVKDLSKKENSLGFLLPPFKKEEIFKTVILDGSLPRKAFSMGEAEEKRFYIEARQIVS